jgi:tetratricopeptide (TPR) repeat protein
MDTPQPPRPVTDTPLIVRFEASRSSITVAIAEAYRQAALDDVDMAEAVRRLEQVRTLLLTEPDAFKIWRRLDEVIGATNANTLQPVLVALRVWLKEQLFDQQRKHLGKLFQVNPDVGWREWLRTYAESLVHWRLLLCRALVNMSLPLPDQFHKPHDFQRATQLILHERWAEVYQFLKFLAELRFLHPHTRVQLLIFIGEIHIYSFSSGDRALPFFQQAEQLAPGLWRVLRAMGEYYLEQNDLVKSRSYLEQVMLVAPDEVDSYILMGDLAEKQGNLEEARDKYQEAINRAAGDSDGYRNLLRLYGRPEFIDRYEPYIAPLAEYAKVVDDTAEYGTYIDVGEAYTFSQRYDTAHQWYDKAIHLDPSRLAGYIWKGFAYLDEGESRYDAACEVFEAAIRVAPEAFNGYWGMGQLAERRDQWVKAIEWYAQAVQRQPEYYSAIHSKIGAMHMKLGQFEEAEAALLDALQHDHTNDETVLALVEDYYKNQGKLEETLRLLEKIREIKGEAFEASYQNRVGNVYYYNGCYAKAEQHYLKAIQSDDRQVVYFSNLANAYRGLKRWADAREYLRKAYDLDGDQQEYESQLVQVYNEAAQALEELISSSADGLEQLDEVSARVRIDLEQAQGKQQFAKQLSRLDQLRTFVVRYGKHALNFELIDKPICVRVQSEFLPHILKEGKKELSEDFISLIGTMRERLCGRYGLSVPGLNFSELTAPAPIGYYQIEVMGEQVATGQLQTDDMVNAPENLLRNIERVLGGHLDKLCGHQETANLLAQCQTSDCILIQDDPHKLSALNRRLKTILSQGGSIADLAPIAADVNERAMSDKSRLERPTPQLAPGITALTLYFGRLWPVEKTLPSQDLIDLQTQLFNELGVIAPLLTIVDSQHIDQIGFQLQINDEKLPPQTLGPVEFVAAELRRRADQLLTPHLIEYYLTKLKVQFPALVNVTRHYFSVEELTGRLRERLSRHTSIKNLPKVLEELISEEGVYTENW